jgi:signal transduction histidine kinase
LTTSRPRGGSVAFVPALDALGGAATRRLDRLDLALPALLGVLGTLETAGAGYRPAWLVAGTFWVAAALLCARRLVPPAMPLVTAALYAASLALGEASELASWVLLLAFACFAAGLHTPPARRTAGLAATLGALAITMAGAWLTDFTPNLLFGLIVSVGAWGLGLALQRALEENRRLGIEAERARSERALAPVRAVRAERRRIAAELHDVLAHALAAMVVRATVGADGLGRDPATAAAAFHDVTRIGRDALAETGRLLRLIRDDGAEPAAHAPPPPPARESPPARARIRRGDLVLPAAFGVMAAIEVVATAIEPRAGSAAACWAAAAVLCARRALPAAMPVAVALIAVIAARLGADTDEPAAWIPLLALACFAPGLYTPRGRVALGAAAVLGAIAIMGADAVARADVSWDAVFVLAFAVAPWAVGVGLNRALQRSRELAAAAEHARIERALASEHAAAAERKRVARELHDVLANSLSVMVVQASVAGELAAGDAPGAAAAAAEVQRSGAAALEEIGRLLRRIGAGPGRRPQPSLSDLPTLADEYRRAGLGLRLELDAAARRLPLGVELSTYRIVQEGLTNVLKYAPGSPVRVRLRHADGEVAIEVRNGRPGAVAVAAVSGGHGLAGMRERVDLLGGALDARPTGDGGFVLAATIPVAGDTS